MEVANSPLLTRSFSPIPTGSAHVLNYRPVEESAAHSRLLPARHSELSVSCRCTVSSSDLSVFISCVLANGFDKKCTNGSVEPAERN